MDTGCCFGEDWTSVVPGKGGSARGTWELHVDQMLSPDLEP